LEELMATQPKPKPRPEPEPPEPKPEEDDAAVAAPTEGPIPGASLLDRVDALFTSQTALIERVEKLEERVNAPPIGLGKRP
jgi:hypothetical protein